MREVKDLCRNLRRHQFPRGDDILSFTAGIGVLKPRGKEIYLPSDEDLIRLNALFPGSNVQYYLCGALKDTQNPSEKRRSSVVLF